MTNESSIHDLLSAPFAVGELKFFPVALTKDKAKGRVGSYIDARAVMDRLDAVVGAANWGTNYRIIDTQTKAVECTLGVSFDGVITTTKSDVGYPNEGRDADNADKEPYKAAYSDALKRAAVQFGIGRYIYSLELEQDWLPVDQYGKFSVEPRLKGSTAPPAPRQAPPSGPVSQAAYDQAQLMALMVERGVTKADLIEVTGVSPNGNAALTQWFTKNPGKTVDQLVSLAVDTKQQALADAHAGTV